MKKNKFVKMLIVISVICLILLPFTSIVHGESKTKSSGVACQRVTVSSGDTLWTIASQYINQSDDVRRLVYEIRKINKLNSAIIVPGQELLIPTL